jgi:hypothetical protein
MARANDGVSGPHCGWEIYHMKAFAGSSPTGSYASQTSDWFGQIIQRLTMAAKRSSNTVSTPRRANHHA